MVKEKTKGNLTSDEERLIEYVLYDLRMKYVKTGLNPVENSIVVTLTYLGAWHCRTARTGGGAIISTG